MSTYKSLAITFCHLLLYVAIITMLPFLLDRALLGCGNDRKVPGITSEAILSPSERYQNFQNNPEYNSVLPFAVNMLKTH